MKFALPLGERGKKQVIFLNFLFSFHLSQCFWVSLLWPLILKQQPRLSPASCFCTPGTTTLMTLGSFDLSGVKAP